MEPDLQALNNSFMAAAKAAHALPNPNFNMSQCSVIGSNASQVHDRYTTTTTPSIRHPVLPSATSTTTVLSDANFCNNLDPALQPTGPPGTESEQSDMAKDDSSGSDESSEDEEMGWEEVRGYHSTHPGMFLPIFIQVALKSCRFFGRRATTPTSGGSCSSNRSQISVFLR